MRPRPSSASNLHARSADPDRKKDCTYCKTVQPSLIFSRSSNATFPVEHQVEPSPERAIEAAKANADKLAKGQRWDEGLTLPGKLDMSAFKFSDEQTSVVFEDADMVGLPAPHTAGKYAH